MLKKQNLKSILVNAGSLIVICIISALLIRMLSKSFTEKTPLYVEFAIFALMLVWILISAIITKIIYEVAHIIIGKICGYKFVAMGICGIWLIKRDGKIKLTRASMYGINQGVVMAPPLCDGGYFPVIGYNNSGIIFTVALTIISAAICLFTNIHIYAKIMLIIFALQNAIFAATSEFSSAENGGAGPISSLLKHSWVSIERVWKLFTISELLTKGTSLCEIEPQTFETDENDIISIKLKRYSYIKMLYSGNFSDAKAGLLSLLDHTTKNSILYLTISADVCTLNLLLGEEYIPSKRLLKYIKSKSYDIPLLRTRYAIELLLNKKNKRAKRIRKKIERIAKRSIFEGTAKDELELIEQIYKCSVKDNK